MSIRPVLITKKSGIVVSYHDASIFYATKGDGIDKLQETMPDVPYGIINSIYGQDSLNLRFSESDLICYLKPGVFHVYGRQIEIPEELEVLDFHTIVESNKTYCTVYAEISLEDYTQQRVQIKVDLSGANYKNFTATGIQDDLYRMDHGVYQVPIAHFTYTPVGDVHFQNAERIIPFLADGTRNNAKNLIGNINDVSISNLFEMKLGVNDTTTGKLNKASNEEALSRYNQASTHNSSTPGYSVAKESNKFGGTSFDQALTGVTTVKRYPLASNIELGGPNTITKTISFKRSKAKKLRFSFAGSFTAEFWFRMRSVGLFGLPQETKYIVHQPDHFEDQRDRNNYVITERPIDKWLSIPEIGQSINFIFYYQYRYARHEKEAWYQWFDVNSGLCLSSEYDSLEGVDDQFGGISGIQNTKRKLGYIEIKVVSENQIKVTFSPNTRTKWDGWGVQIYEWITVENLSNFVNNTLKATLDILYEGDIRLWD